MSSTTPPQANMRLGIVVLTITLTGTACGGDGSNLNTAAEGTQLAFTVQPSSANAGQTLTPPIQVSIQDASGSSFSSGDSPVTLALALHPSGATLSGTTTVNARAGVATFSDLRISQPGTGFVLSASAPGLTGTVSSPFDITPVSGVAVAIAPTAGDGQTARVNEPVAINPAVRVTDGLGNPVANVGVNFSVVSGEGSVSGPDQITDAAGIATVGQWTLGIRVRENFLSATFPGLASSPAIFHAAAIAGPAAALAKSDGDEQVARPGMSVATSPSVFVGDRFGNAVGGAPVTFEVTSGGGSVTGAAQTTGTDGIAAVGSWTLGRRAGPNTLQAVSLGLDGSPMTFTATVTVVDAVVEVRDNYFRSLDNGSGGENNFFGEAAVDTIPVGGSVLWEWVGNDHNVTGHTGDPSAGLTGSGTRSAPSTYGPITFTKRGLYRYRCTIHSQVTSFFGLTGMRGEIVVR